MLLTKKTAHVLPREYEQIRVITLKQIINVQTENKVTIPDKTEQFDFIPLICCSVLTKGSPLPKIIKKRKKKN